MTLGAKLGMINDFSAETKQIRTNNAFLLHGQFDGNVSVMNTFMFYQNLLTQNISTSLHILPTDIHDVPFEMWNFILKDWLTQIGII